VNDSGDEKQKTENDIYDEIFAGSFFQEDSYRGNEYSEDDQY
jgi:hypothetical protein